MTKLERVNSVMFRVSTVFYFTTGKFHLDAAKAKTEDERKKFIEQARLFAGIYSALQKHTVALAITGKLNNDDSDLPYPFGELEPKNESDILKWMQGEILETLRNIKESE